MRKASMGRGQVNTMQSSQEQTASGGKEGCDAVFKRFFFVLGRLSSIRKRFTKDQ